MNMKRKRMTRREFIDDMEFTRDFTRLPIEAQYLVTLNVLSSRTQRRTDSPRGGMIFSLVRISSRILLMTTKQSKRLNSDMK